MRVSNLIILICFLLIFLGLYFNIKRDQEPSTALDVKTARKLVKQNHFDYVIDVRSQREFNENRFIGAINIPLNDLYKGVKLYDMNSNILLYEGPRAAMGQRILIEMGFKNTMYLKGDYKRLNINVYL